MTKTRITILSSFFDLARMHGDVLKFFAGTPELEQIELVEAEPDLYVVQNYTQARIEKESSIVYQMEPVDLGKSQWTQLMTWFPGTYRDFALFGWNRFHLNNLEWHLSLSANELLKNEIVKTMGGTLGVVISSYYSLPGHKLRFDFVRYLDERGFDMDVYGRSQSCGFRNHKGELPNWIKDDAILPYKYVFNAENCELNNYVTEKFVDAIVGECLIFYHGCPNLEDWFNPRCFIRLDLNDRQGSLKLMQEAIQNDEWGRRIEVIREEKRKLINAYSFLPRTVGVIQFLKVRVQVLGSYRQLREFARKAEAVNLNCYETVLDTGLAAHQQLWRRSVASGETLLILSATATLSYDFIDRLTHLLQVRHDNGWGHLIISHPPLPEEALNHRWSLLHPVEMTAAPVEMAASKYSQGYLVRPAGAGRLIGAEGGLEQRLATALPVSMSSRSLI